VKRIVVLGGGAGGTLVANLLRRLPNREAAEFVVVDSDDGHLYQPGLPFVPFGLAEPASLVRPRRRQLQPGVAFRQAAVDRVDRDGNEVRLADGTRLGYDVLVVATGAALVPEETEGLTGPDWMEKAFTSTPWTAPRLESPAGRSRRDLAGCAIPAMHGVATGQHRLTPQNKP
jgi:sulfide:quinone oxidoreductase